MSRNPFGVPEECGCGAPGRGLPCGCCEADASPTPREIHNRPALPSIRYRVGTYAEFRRAMLDGIRGKPELSAWTSRRDDDWGVAVLDLWAYVADVLTFYQERIANEAYLRTATLRDSVLKLAALLDYRPGPGKAATADLVFTLDKGRQATVPAGLRVQSVPGQGEKPQKFEVEEAVVVDAALNAVRVHGEPAARTWLRKGHAQAVLDPAMPPPVAAGESLLVVAGTNVEVKEVASVEPGDSGHVLAWTPAMQADGSEARKLLGRHPLLGPSLPSYTFDPTPRPAPPPNPDKVPIGWTATSYREDAGNVVRLDGLVQDVKAGDAAILAHAGGLKLLTVSAVAQDVKPVGNVAVPYTLLTVKDPASPASTTPVPEILDRRKATLYVVGDKLRLAGKTYPPEADAISGDKPLVVPLEALGPAPAPVPAPALAQAAPEPPAPRELLAPGRRVALDDASGRPQVVAITEAKPLGDGRHLRILFSPPLQRSLDPATAVLLGNVARATHGETVKEDVLGDGDAAQPFQRFRLSKPHVTHVPRAGAPRGAATTLRVRVNGILWKELPRLVEAGAADQAFETRLEDDGTTVVQFGDGEAGARLPTGRKNVVASYRQGLGKAGNVRARTLTNLLDKPPGLKAVTNPQRAEGGADPETLENARRLAPMKARTFGRVVSLRDFEDAALDYAGVTKARATWAWEGGEQVVRLTVGGDPDAPLGEQTVKDLAADLDARRDPIRKARVAPYEDVPIRVAIDVEADPRHDPARVEAAAKAALLGALAYERMRFGQGVNLSDLYRAVHGAEGVAAARIGELSYRHDSDRAAHGLPDRKVHPHLPVRATGLASLRPEDVRVTMVKAIAQEE